MKKNLIYLYLFLNSFAFAQQSKTIDSLMNIPLVQAKYGMDFPGGDLKNRFGYNHELGVGIWLKQKKGWMIGVEGSFIFGGQIRGDTNNIKPLQTSNGNIIGITGNGGLYARVNLYERGMKLPVVKVGKLFHKNWLGGSKNSGPFIIAGLGYWQYKLKIHDVDNIVPQLNGDYVKGYDHLTGGIMTSQSIGYLLLDKHKLLNFSIAFECTQGFTQNLRDWNMDTKSAENEKRLDIQYGVKLSWYFPFYPKMSTGYYYY